MGHPVFKGNDHRKVIYKIIYEQFISTFFFNFIFYKTALL